MARGSGTARALAGVGIAVAVAAAPGSARGSSSYPADFVADLNLNCPANFPDCTICHMDDQGGYNTVVTRFGRSTMMLRFGLTSGSDGQLKNILGQLMASGIDSDGDGDSDYSALIHCRDPNVPHGPERPDAGDAGEDDAAVVIPIGPLPPADPVPQYGCTASPTSASSGSDALAAAVVAVLLVGSTRLRVVRRGEGTRTASGST